MYKIYRTKDPEYDYFPIDLKSDEYGLGRYVTRGELLAPAVTLDHLITNINADGETIVQIFETPGLIMPL